MARGCALLLGRPTRHGLRSDDRPATDGGVFLANILAGYINDRSGASAANPAGYDAMLWFFGLLSVAALVFATLLLKRRSGAS